MHACTHAYTQDVNGGERCVGEKTVFISGRNNRWDMTDGRNTPARARKFVKESVKTAGNE